MSRRVKLENKYKKPSGRYTHISDLSKRMESMKKNHYDRNLPLRDHDQAFYDLCELMYRRINEQAELDVVFFQDVEDAQDNPEKLKSICQHKLLEVAVQQGSAPEWEKNAQHYEDLAVFMRSLAQAEGDQTERVVDFINKILDGQEGTK